MKPHQKIILKRQTNYDSSKCTAHTKNCKIDFAEFALNKGNLKIFYLLEQNGGWIMHQFNCQSTKNKVLTFNWQC